MNENINQDILALIVKMQIKLDSMEEKIDSLIRRSENKTYKGKTFSKPYREHDKAKHKQERKYGARKDEGSSERKFYHGSPFGKKKETGKSNFKGRKKPFNKSLRENKDAF